METLTDDYVAFVQERLRDVRQACADPQVLIEQRLDFFHVVPGGFGTGDCVIIAEPVLRIIDLKYGQGSWSRPSTVPSSCCMRSVR